VTLIVLAVLVHFTGTLPYRDYRRLLQVSAAHVYLTYPYVLSWSVLEAMACGCVVIGSDTAPVREVIRHGENGLLVDFFDHASLGETLLMVLDRQEDFASLRENARNSALESYSAEHGTMAYRRLIAGNPSSRQIMRNKL